MLLFVYGTIKFLWMREWGYACATSGVIALGPMGVALTLWNRDRRMRAAEEREALELQASHAPHDHHATESTVRMPVAVSRPSAAPLD